MPELSLSLEGKLDPTTLFPSPKSQYWFEIGFGAGEHLAELMRRNPDHGFIGAEPFINGMAAFLKEIQDEPHENVRVWMDDALMVIEALPDQCLDGIYILNPDPWPKKKHHKRRIVNRENLDQYARVLKHGGQLIMTTDVPGLAEWMVTEAFTHPAFKWTAQSASDWRQSPDDWITTAYETKKAKGADRMCYLFFIRK